MKKYIIIFTTIVLFQQGVIFSKEKFGNPSYCLKIGYFNPTATGVEEALITGLEIKYTFKLIGKIGLEYDFSNADVRRANGSMKYHIFSINYILPIEKDTLVGSFYYGGGLGYIHAKRVGTKYSKATTNLVFGYRSPVGFFGEFKYISANTDKNLKMGGISLMLGYSFK